MLGYHNRQGIFPRKGVFLNHVNLIHFALLLILVSVEGPPKVLLYITSMHSVHLMLAAMI